MLNGIKEKMITKLLCGLMLASITLSFSGGILSMSLPNPKSKPVAPVAKKAAKPFNIRKKEAVNVNQAIAANQGVRKSDWNGANPVGNTVAKSEMNLSYSDATNGLKANKPVANNRWQADAPKPGTNSHVDLYLLARVIYAESRGEPLQGQVGVGAVLLNRLKDSRFPKSLAQIVFKQGEFCTVRDGQIWKTPSQEAIKAARLAAAGWDPTGGALYFYNPAKTTSRWIWSRTVVNKIGNHIFAI
jgi:spore germination cell wall hydrolase CwlJ-like protein